MDVIIDNKLLINTFICNVINTEHSMLVNDHMKHAKDSSLAFINEYFDCFFLLFKLGKCFYQKNYTENSIKSISTIQIEYLSVLFAKTYLEYKNETDYLQKIKSKSVILLKMHENTTSDRIDDQYILFENKKDYKSYAAFHFNVLAKTFEKTVTFESILKLISNGNYTSINHSVILRKGLTGIDLVNECLQTVIELNDSVPEVLIDYSDFFETMRLQGTKVFA